MARDFGKSLGSLSSDIIVKKVLCVAMHVSGLSVPKPAVLTKSKDDISCGRKPGDEVGFHSGLDWEFIVLNADRDHGYEQCSHDTRKR